MIITMTIDEAIILLQKDLDDSGSVDILCLNKAQELSIEALNRVKDRRSIANYSASYLLPGETK